MSEGNGAAPLKPNLPSAFPQLSARELHEMWRVASAEEGITSTSWLDLAVETQACWVAMSRLVRDHTRPRAALPQPQEGKIT